MPFNRSPYRLPCSHRRTSSASKQLMCMASPRRRIAVAPWRAVSRCWSRRPRPLMARQYTQCYDHTPGDKPFSRADLLAFVAGNAWPGATVAILAFLGGAPAISIIAIFIQSAVTVTAVAYGWLDHRLVCMPSDALPCAIGTVIANPTVGDLGEFDNDQYFSIRLMPHPPLPDHASDQDKRDFASTVTEDPLQGK